MKRTEIKLKAKEVSFLREYKKTQGRSEREYNRANVLLLLDKGKKDAEIADFLDIERTTIWRIRQKYLKEGLARALEEKTRSGQPVKYGAREKAEIIATACSSAPDGRSRWTLALLKDELSRREGFETINKESIRLVLKKTNVSRG